VESRLFPSRVGAIARIAPLSRTRRPLRTRGASLVEYLIIVGVVALSALGAFAIFKDELVGVAGWEADCVRSMSCKGNGNFPEAGNSSGSGGSSGSSGSSGAAAGGDGPPGEMSDATKALMEGVRRAQNTGLAGGIQVAQSGGGTSASPLDLANARVVAARAGVDAAFEAKAHALEAVRNAAIAGDEAALEKARGNIDVVEGDFRRATEEVRAAMEAREVVLRDAVATEEKRIYGPEGPTTGQRIAAGGAGAAGLTVGMVEGTVYSVWDSVVGVYTLVRHPIQTAEGVVAFFTPGPVPTPAEQARRDREYLDAELGDRLAQVQAPFSSSRDDGVMLGRYVIGPVAQIAAGGTGLVSGGSKVGTVGNAGRVSGAVKVAGEIGEELAENGGRVARVADKVDCPGGICTVAGNCFAAGTPVSLADGSHRSIERIAEGDQVLARDPVTGETAARRVTHTMVTPDREVVEIALEAQAPGASDGSRVTRETITVTAEHPFWVDGKGFRPVRDLAPDDAVQTLGGLARVASLASLPARITVYNFEVEDAHTYFVGASQAWVHNACGLKVGDDVLVPRTDGSISGGKVVASVGDGRVMVEVPGPGGTTGTKVVPESSLVRRRELGERVTLSFNDGTSAVAEVTGRGADGTAKVVYRANGNIHEATVPESWLRNVDPNQTLPPSVRPPTPPVKQFGEPYVAFKDGYYPSGLFSNHIPNPAAIPAEGWKLHVSATVEKSYAVSDRLLPQLREMGVPHKVMTDPAAYAKMTGTQEGKFITIYARSPEEAAALAQGIERALADIPAGPVVSGEKALGKHTYARYGGFTKETVTNPRTGMEVGDVRGQVAPDWIPDPFIRH